MIKFFYRISNNSYQKAKLPNASKENCFLNFLAHLYTSSDAIDILADNINDELKLFLQANLPSNGRLLEINTGSNGSSFRQQMQMACEMPDEQIVMLHEDDYLYRPHPDDLPTHKYNRQVITEGLARAHYVSLYDHPDKYLPRLRGINEQELPVPISPAIYHPLMVQGGVLWGNPLVRPEGIEDTGVFLTEHTHWKLTNSTTLTFAAYAKTLKEDYAIWEQYSRGPHPDDFEAFIALRAAGRKIATPIPGLATNTEYPWITPFFDWDTL
jgi:hypothetical protein